jgi:hypothetical protein
MSNKDSEISSFQSQITRRCGYIRELKKDRENKAPLMDTGVAIRGRFLEQERISPVDGLATRKNIRKDIIDEDMLRLIVIMCLQDEYSGM